MPKLTAVRPGVRELWLATNVLGIAAFLKLASLSWIEPELANEPGASGGSFIVWGLSAFPVFLVFVSINIGWALVAERRAINRGKWITISLAIFTLLCWFAAFVFDNIHHGA